MSGSPVCLKLCKHKHKPTPFLAIILHSMLNIWPTRRAGGVKRSLSPDFAPTFCSLMLSKEKKKGSQKHLLPKCQLKHLHSPSFSPHLQTPPLSLCPQLQIAWEMFISSTCFRMSSSSWKSLGRAFPGSTEVCPLSRNMCRQAVSEKAPTGG